MLNTTQNALFREISNVNVNLGPSRKICNVNVNLGALGLHSS